MSEPAVRLPPNGAPAPDLVAQIRSQARWSVDAGAPLFLLVFYRREDEKRDLVERLGTALRTAGLEMTAYDLAAEPERGAGRFYDLLAAAGEREVAVVRRMTQAPGGLQLDSDLLAYLNLHRDRIARENLRWIVFLHEADAEQFQREAGDLWDVRQHTFWLDGEPVPREERVWIKVDRNLETSGRPEIEAGREEIEAPGSRWRSRRSWGTVRVWRGRSARSECCSRKPAVRRRPFRSTSAASTSAYGSACPRSGSTSTGSTASAPSSGTTPSAPSWPSTSTPKIVPLCFS